MSERSGRELRTSVRLPYHLTVTVYGAADFASGVAVDISEGGIFLATHQPMAEGSEVELELPLPFATFTVTAVVRWTRARWEGNRRPPGMGLQFLDLPEVGLAAIRALAAQQPT